MKEGIPRQANPANRTQDPECLEVLFTLRLLSVIDLPKSSSFESGKICSKDFYIVNTVSGCSIGVFLLLLIHAYSTKILKLNGA